MINTKSPKFQILLNKIHNNLEKQYNRNSNDTNIILNNRIFKSVLEKPYLSPKYWTQSVNKQYNYSLTINDVINILRSTKTGITIPDKRDRIVKRIKEISTAFNNALALGTPESAQNFRHLRNSIFEKERSYYRFICLDIFNNCPELKELDNFNFIETFSKDTTYKYILYGLTDALAEYCNDVKKNNSSFNKTNKLSVQDLHQRVFSLEKELKRANMMMQDLQDELEEQLSDAKLQEMATFFANLNDDKYGSILDSLLQVLKGINELKREHVVLDPRISGLFIVIQKLSQFVKDNHINPIMKLHSKQNITANEADQCEYHGTPFKDSNETKTIYVYSPGWSYKDKNIIISLPKIKEVTENE